jgi:uncharacterized protein
MEEGSMTAVTLVTWREVDELVGRVAQAIFKSDFVPTQVVAVGRGGMVPARLLADLLEVHKVDVLPVSRYEGQNGGEVRLNFKDRERVLPRALLVDDVADKGETLVAIDNHFVRNLHYQGPNRLRYAVLHLKRSSVFLPDFFGREADSSWLAYPWERRETQLSSTGTPIGVQP